MSHRKTTALTVLFAIVLGTAISAQVCPQPLPLGFEGLNGSGAPTPDNQAILNIVTNTDSTDALNFDNTAHAALGETIAIRFDDARVSAGQPFAMMMSLGVQPFPVATPLLDGNIWLNPASVVPLLDGLGLFGAPNPFASTAGPNNVYQINGNTGQSSSNIGRCYTVQIAVFDPIAPAPYHLAISNPVAFGITPGIQSLSPQIVAANGQVTVTAAGLSPFGGDVIAFPDGVTRMTSAGGVFTVPASMTSGQVTLDIGGAGVPSTIVPDSILDYIAVKAPIVTNAPGPLTMTNDPNLPYPSASRGTGQATLFGPGSVDVWTVTMNAGDVLEVEVYSTNAGFTRIFDGLGATINPFVTEGFDPIVSIEQATNGGDTLLFDPTYAASGPYLLHYDDNDGPENNSYLIWQAKTTGVYNIVVGDANANAFVTGSYVLNVRRIQGYFPCATSFLTGATRTNIVSQTGTLTVVAANVTIGNVYDVTFFPMVGGVFSSRTAYGVPCTINGRLNVPIPASQPGNLPMGLHQVQITNATTGAGGLIWDNTRVVQPFGPLPDLCCIRGSTRTQVTTNTISAIPGGSFSGLVSQPVTNLNAQSLLFGPFPATASSTAVGDGYFDFTAPAGAYVVYVEALGVSDVQFERFDSHEGLTNLNGIYNPTVQLYRPGGLLDVGPYNDDDGQVPSLIFDYSMGIGNSSSLIDFDGPAFYPNGGDYVGLLQELVLIGISAGLNSHYCLVNVVVL